MQDTQTISIADFIAKHGIKFECRRVDSRPDGLMDDSDSRSGHGPTATKHMVRHFRCRIVRNADAKTWELTSVDSARIKCDDCPKPATHGRTVTGGAPFFYECDEHYKPSTKSFGLYFSQGSAHTSDPTLADVLDCLASDASGYESAYGNGGTRFEQWADEYGYDTDSRTAEKTFRAIKRQAEQLKRTLGDAAYEELLWKVERQ